jgi:hypothetical protein
MKAGGVVPSGFQRQEGTMPKHRHSLKRLIVILVIKIKIVWTRR